MTNKTPPPNEAPKLFLSTMLYAAAKRLGYQMATQELFRQVTQIDPSSESAGIPAALTLARAAALEPAQLNVNAGATVIGKARSLAAAEFLASEANVWLSVDDDVSVSPDAIQTAISQARAEPCLVIVPCLLRDTLASPNPAPVINLVASAVTMLDRAPNGGQIETVDAGGFGCFAVSREVIETVNHWMIDRGRGFRHEGQTLQALFRDELLDGEWVTEDLAFCRLVSALGFRRWAVRVGRSIHAGQRLDLATLDALLPKVTDQPPRVGH
jgi:hypothetical protein